MKNFNINLNELNFENIGQWPAVIKYIVSGLITILIVGIGVWMLILPHLETYKELVNSETELRTEFENKQQQAATLPKYRAQLYTMEERFGNMLRQLPAQNQMPGLLEDISKTGVASGLTFKLFAPQTQVVHDFYVELPINIEVVGTYHQLAIFLSRVAQMSRIVTLHDFEIFPISMDKEHPKQNNPAISKEAESDLLTMKLTAKIYRYRTIK